MPCTCKNPDGTLSPICKGECSLQKYIVNLESQIRALESSFTPTQRQQLADIIMAALRDCGAKPTELWIDGFLKGFEHGKNNGY